MEESVGAGRQGLLLNRLFRMKREDKYFRLGRKTPDGFRSLEAIHNRHTPIQNYQVRLEFQHFLDRFLPVFCLAANG